jgi:hypothetical protein
VKKRYDAVVVTGKYTDSSGKEKNRYLTVGAVLENEHGHLSLKLEAIPVVGFNGWINFYAPKDRTDGQAAGKSGDKPAAKEDFDDKIPF